MKTEFSSSSSWNSAALSGLILAAVTIALALAQGAAGKLGGIPGGLLGILAWIAKVVACVVCFRWFLIRFHEKYSDVDYTRLKNHGLKIGLLSSIIVSGYSLVEATLINPDEYKEAINTSIEPFLAQMDSNTIASLDQVIGQMPTYSFFISLIYCFIWGWVLSVIFAKAIEPADPFQNEGNKTTDIQ